MRSAVILSQLALWATTTHAFYPFTPPWALELAEKRSEETDENGLTFTLTQRNGHPMNPSPNRVAREAARLSKKYDQRSPIEADDASLERRENVYDIFEALPTEEPLTTGLNQDGTDYSYFAGVQLGSKGKVLQMLIDTGAGSTWVMGTDCTTKACGYHESYGPKDSDTFQEYDEDTFDIKYGTGHIIGNLANDTISVAGMSFPYLFGVAHNVSDDFVHFAFDGILGLSMNDGTNKNFLTAMKEAGEIQQSVFGVSIHRASDGANNGEIKFGGTNKDRYLGNITYTPITKDTTDWSIEIDDMGYDGRKAGAGGVRAYIDTGTTFIFGPQSLVKAIHSVIPGSETSDNTSYRVPCDSNKPLAFTFSGVDYTVSPKDWISPQNTDGKCTSNIYGQEVVKGSWLLGDTFLKNVYAVFDKDKKAIGFANQVPDPSQPTSTLVPNPTAPGETTRPSLGIPGGPETTDATGASKPEASKPTEASSTSLGGNSHYVFVVCVATLFALLA